MTRLRCPNHTPCPTDYSAWMHWAIGMSKSHEQTKCRQCGRYLIWVKRKDKRRLFLHPPASARVTTSAAAAKLLDL